MDKSCNRPHWPKTAIELTFFLPKRKVDLSLNFLRSPHLVWFTVVYLAIVFVVKPQTYFCCCLPFLYSWGLAPTTRLGRGPSAGVVSFGQGLGASWAVFFHSTIWWLPQSHMWA